MKWIKRDENRYTLKLFSSQNETPALRQLSSFEKVDSTVRNCMSNDPTRKLHAGDYRATWDKLSALPYFKSTVRYEGRYDNYPWWRTVQGCPAGWQLPGVSFLNVVERDPILTQLTNCALNKIHAQHLDILTFVAELDQAAAMVGNAISRMDNALAAIASKNFGRANKVLRIRKPKGASRSKHFADNYLAYNFGFIPLYNDALGAIRHLAEVLPRTIVDGSCFTKYPSAVDLRFARADFNNGGTDMCTVKTSFGGQHERICRVGVTFRVDDGIIDTARRLGLTNGARAVWNTIPYSFLIDTFLNVGSWLADIDRGFGLVYVSGYYTEMVKVSGPMKITSTWSNPPSTSRFKNHREDKLDFECTYDKGMIYRERFTKEPAVKLQFSSPLSVQNAVNVTALAVQRWVPNKTSRAL